MWPKYRKIKSPELIVVLLISPPPPPDWPSTQLINNYEILSSFLQLHGYFHLIFVLLFLIMHLDTENPNLKK